MDGGGKDIWVIANWKSNKTIAEALEWVSIVGPKIPKRDPESSSGQGLKVVVCPTFSCLSEIAKIIKAEGFPMMVGSQDISPFSIGAYTGEEAAPLIKDLVSLSIIGHSERRKNFSETDELVAQKTAQALAAGITTLVCVQGEETPVPQGCKLVAYEPVWAISTGLANTPGVGRVDTPEDANKVAKIFKQKYPDLEVLYGGSVDSSNVKSFVDQLDINGVLVGNASLDALEFVKIVNALE